MLRFLVKFAVPLMLLLTLVSLSGIVSASVGMSSAVSDLCCDTTDEQPAPVTDDDCTDHSCSHSCCNAFTLTSHVQLTSLPKDPETLQWAPISELSSGCIRSIDYPPEIPCFLKMVGI
jgi:hypothetical protein